MKYDLLVVTDKQAVLLYNRVGPITRKLYTADFRSSQFELATSIYSAVDYVTQKLRARDRKWQEFFFYRTRNNSEKGQGKQSSMSTPK